MLPIYVSSQYQNNKTSVGLTKGCLLRYTPVTYSHKMVQSGGRFV